MLQKYFTKLFLFILSTAFVLPADADAPFGSILLHHVVNDINKVYVPIHIGGLDLSITKHVILVLSIGLITVLIGIMAVSKYKSTNHKVPSRFSGLFEVLVEFINKDMVVPNIGKKYTRTWTPLIATFFLFILLANFIGLIPFLAEEFFPGGSSTITGNITVTAALALITFIAIIVAGTMKHGFIGHWKNMIPGGVPKPVLLILIPVEIMGMFIKPLALMLRLGANMTAGHIGMVAIFGLPLLMMRGGFSEGIGLSVGGVAILLNTAIFFLEMIVCMVQAYVFSLLSAVFIGMAIHAEH